MNIKKQSLQENDSALYLTDLLNNSADLSLLSALEDLISIVDENYYYRAVSAGYTKFFGIHNESIVGKHVSELHGQDRFEQIIKPFLDKALQGEEVSLQFWGKNHTGEERFIDSRHTFYDGLPIKSVAVVARDITDQITAHIALGKEKRMLTTMIDALPGFIFIKDHNGIYQRCNRSFEVFLNKKNSEIIGFSDDDLMSKKSANYIKGNDRKVLQGNEIRCDEKVTYNNGDQRLLDMLKIPLYNDDEHIEGIVGIGHDVTDERETESKLKLAALVFETTSEPCFILDKNGYIQTANVAAKSNIMHSQKSDKHLLSITDFIFCFDGNLLFKDIIATKRQWAGDVITKGGQPFLATLNCTLDNNNIPDNYVLLLRDNTSSKIREMDLSNKAYYDYLTGLPNRLQLESNLNSAIIRCERQKKLMAALFIDLDKFKPINDQFGHFEGDKVLIEIAARIKLEIRKVDLVARMGGDEFVVIIDIESIDQAKHVAQKLIAQIEQPLIIQKSSTTVSASIGISIYPDDANNAKELLEHADQAMYEAKLHLDAAYCYYHEIIKGDHLNC
ncbi:sensor domain-containing protein [Colwellia psychrerythraea]|uniref:Diguanylate cyclase with PAS/PAC sensor n=1 Tax=Colwellia psychrerythraea TaxID=28229 RepID=A0A099KIY2_COLPS|nr:diguanylate cyclase [Colwellia psychrerythraea]KGJ90366.1 diguanylate cyclase with PAS/PAC sensor [Colwellia psychrerythraea]